MHMQPRPVGDVDRVPWCSLANALRLILHRNGCDADIDDLHAALADPWSFCAVPSESDLARWPLYARDRYLVDAGRLFGLTIRPVHPPEAARGLPHAEEFRQHFDASYRPLILRALENDQPVLAWRGWPGPWDSVWGIIRKTSSGELGFCGSVTAESVPTIRCDGPNKSGEGDIVELVSPPTQVYIVERVQARKPEPDALLRVAFDHARNAFADGPIDAFEVVGGRSAWEMWANAIRLADSERREPAHVSLATSHTLLARSVVERYRCAEPFLARQTGRVGPTVSDVSLSAVPDAHRRGDDGHNAASRAMTLDADAASRSRAVVGALRRGCQVVVTFLAPSMEAGIVFEALRTSRGRRDLLCQIETACDAAEAMLRVLTPDERERSRWSRSSGAHAAPTPALRP